MVYELRLTPGAGKQLYRLQKEEQKRIIAKLEWFVSQTNPLIFARKIHDVEAGDYRFRVGDYHIIFVVEKNGELFTVTSIGHRRDIYR
ncbi:MAG TPA: hypothetical protein DCY48_02730 [Candidatus Magasanikbacteria bacterium]|nr:MAG: hypothetical protein A3I74_02090 [Candidatus Magasanikbacteria bacterium RIFCSPLOWO2_02_FULL_47_16]OGH79695.1 MAG: hypothetical protein A3C10_01315 [Candidatus Magasanikbacteria bacterium RIFCSPHIGHO2_02_FULL_48_18]OGH82863.1 MAG: hypothetical protein A3G08_00840 [Candidatus Magasanikbacteria bacterium RIFCSPLOWO2_12_FULL_47_9b]HAZ28667.1 hypothetical protein [Candidatus Magasanikbacteria bacterium]